MASIKPIEGGSIHRIQSGQVIVDLCSVVKELVENSLDAGATAIDVRFRNHGLDSMEVQDNGSGISETDYETVALKHYTSKLSTYDDLGTLQTFGFRGEALSSLCAVSDMHIVTAREQDAPKGTRLNFELSGKLKDTQVVASQRGTTVAVETVFKNLPVRRQELVKNIKREYGKVLGLLQAYACITTTARVCVSNVITKGKKAVVFSTKSNQATKDNIANIFGAKTLPALIPLDLQFEMQTSSGIARSQADAGGKQVRVLGHVSRPVFGEGRQTPDRQMFFVNGRPCGLPQVAKIFNEVYKSYNLSQSPFIFANVILDTAAYDVNVSPDKRMILLHDQGALLEAIKTSLTELFENQQHTVPQSQNTTAKLPDYKQPTLSRQTSTTKSQSSSRASIEARESDADQVNNSEQTANSLIQNFAGRNAQDRGSNTASRASSISTSNGLSADKQKLVNKLARAQKEEETLNEFDDARDIAVSDALVKGVDIPVQDFNRRLASLQAFNREAQELPTSESPQVEEEIPSINNSRSKPEKGVVPNAFDRMRPIRTPAQTATITVGSKTMTAEIGSPSLKKGLYTRTPIRQIIRQPPRSTQASSQFSSTLRSFAAPGTRMKDQEADESDEQPDDGSVTGSVAPEEADNTSVEELQRSLPRQSEKPYGNYEALTDTEASEVERDVSESTQELSNDESVDEDAESDDEYLDDETKKANEEAKVARLILEAETKAAMPLQDSVNRAQYLLRGGGMRETTANLRQSIGTSTYEIDVQLELPEDRPENLLPEGAISSSILSDTSKSAEERLSLIVSKGDFASMRIIGQFNLGFIIVLRPPHLGPTFVNSEDTSLSSSDELFIIDQHASDEKYNFERLQATTTVQNQRLVHPQVLDLTAIEEETVIENQDALVKNGFLLSVDESGDVPVGRRCRLLSLPMSKEVTFSTRDLEELLVLLTESPPPSSLASTSVTANVDNRASWANPNQHIPRPSAIRRMFAMRACRSSVMIGKTLTKSQMEKLVSKMGELEKPWNCPHGRPTMRHLAGLDGWESWKEGDGRGDRLSVGLEEGDAEGVAEADRIDGFWETDRKGRGIRWAKWLAKRTGATDEDEENGGDDEDGEIEKDEEHSEGEHKDGAEDVEESTYERSEHNGSLDENRDETFPNIANRFRYNHE